MDSTEDDPKREALARIYARMPSTEIIRRLADGGLTELAQHIARRELARRELDQREHCEPPPSPRSLIPARRTTSRRVTSDPDSDARVVLPPLADPATRNLGPWWLAVVMWLGNAYGVWVWWSGFAPKVSQGTEWMVFAMQSLLGIPIACGLIICVMMMPMLVRNTLWRIGVSLTLLALYLLLHGKPSIWVLADAPRARGAVGGAVARRGRGVGRGGAGGAAPRGPLHVRTPSRPRPLVYTTDAPQARGPPPRNSRGPGLTWEIPCPWA